LKISKDKSNECKRWLEKYKEDLESAKLLYENHLFAPALYHLQQSNEKLTKALLIYYGWLLPSNVEKEDREALLVPEKTPKDYGHRLAKNFFNDLKKILPELENSIKYLKYIKLFLTLFLTSIYKRYEEEFNKFQPYLKNSKDKIEKIIDFVDNFKIEEKLGNKEELEKGLEKILELYTIVDELYKEMVESVNSINLQDILSKNLGDSSNLGKTNEILELILKNIKNEEYIKRFFFLYVTVCVSLSILLDPLESITRYPQEQEIIFDENNFYVQSFDKIINIISAIANNFIMIQTSK